MLMEFSIRAKFSRTKVADFVALVFFHDIFLKMLRIYQQLCFTFAPVPDSNIRYIRVS
jgi:hypothetical protein